MHCMSVKIKKNPTLQEKTDIVQNTLINILKIQKIQHHQRWQRWPTAQTHYFLPRQAVAVHWSENRLLDRLPPVGQGSKTRKGQYLGQVTQSLMAKMRFLKPIKLLNKVPAFQNDVLRSPGYQGHLFRFLEPNFIDSTMSVFTCTGQKSPPNSDLVKPFCTLAEAPSQRRSLGHN